MDDANFPSPIESPSKNGIACHVCRERMKLKIADYINASSNSSKQYKNNIEQ